MSVRRATPTLLLLVVATGCTPDAMPPEPSLPGDTEQATETTPEAAKPSITRDVPPEQRRVLSDLSASDLCSLVTPEELRRLAFPVAGGQPRELGFDPPARGCSYPSESSVDSVLIAAQPQGYGQLGRDEVAWGPTPGTETLHANDCTVFADVRNATLQVTVVTSEAATEQCDTAESIAGYLLPSILR